MAEEIIVVKLTGEADDLIKALKQALKETKAFSQAADDAGKSTRKQGEESKRAAVSVVQLKSAAQAAGGRIGELAGRAEAAAAAAGPLGVTIGAVAIAMAATTAAAYKLTEGAIDLTRHLGEITDRADELKALGAILDPEDVQSVQDANDALDTLSATFDRLTVSIAGSTGFIGSMERAAGAVNGLFLLLEQNADQVSVLYNIADAAVLSATGFTSLSNVLGIAGAAVDALNESTSELQGQQEYQAWVNEQLAEQEKNRAEIREEDIARINMENKIEAERAKIKQQSAQKAIEAAQKEFEARRAFFEEEDRIFFDNQRKQEAEKSAALERTLERIDLEVQAEAEAIDARQAMQDAEQAAHKQAMMDRAQLYVDYASQVDQIGQMLLEHAIKREGDMEGKATNTRRKVFRMQKAADLASATISTARAVTAALAYPPGPPGTIPMAVATGIAGAVQIGIIAAQQPSFHIGSRAGDLAPDEVRATLTRGEAVLTRQAQSALGLDSDSVATANAGMAGEQTIIMQYQHDRISRRYHADQNAMHNAPRVGRARKL